MYSWWVYLHILGAFAFVFAHGASALAAFRIRAMRDPVQIRTLLDVSSLAIGVMYVGLLLLLIGGIAAGIVGERFDEGWIWAALVILIVIIVAMYAMATPFYGQSRVAAGARAKDLKADPNPVVNQSDIDALAGSNRPAVLLGDRGRRLPADPLADGPQAVLTSYDPRMPTLTAAIRVLAGLAILAVAACDSTGSGANTTPEPTSAADLAGTSWTLVSIGGTPVVEASGPHLTFGANGQASGSTSCNSIHGTYTTDGAALTFGPMATTRMACEGA